MFDRKHRTFEQLFDKMLILFAARARRRATPTAPAGAAGAGRERSGAKERRNPSPAKPLIEAQPQAQEPPTRRARCPAGRGRGRGGERPQARRPRRRGGYPSQDQPPQARPAGRDKARAPQRAEPRAGRNTSKGGTDEPRERFFAQKFSFCARPTFLTGARRWRSLVPGARQNWERPKASRSRKVAKAAEEICLANL